MDERVRLEDDIKAAAQSLPSTVIADLYDKFVEYGEQLADRHRALRLREAGDHRLYLTNDEPDQAYAQLRQDLPPEQRVELLIKVSDTESDRRYAYSEVSFAAGFYAAAALFKEVGVVAKEPSRSSAQRRPRRSSSRSRAEIRSCA